MLVPKLDDVARYLGLVLDENFSTSVLHPDFLELLKSIEVLVSSFEFELRLSCYVANVVENLRTELQVKLSVFKLHELNLIMSSNAEEFDLQFPFQK